MRTIFTTLIVALFLSLGSVSSYAGNDRGNRHEPPRREQHDKKSKKDKKDKKDKKKWEKEQKKRAKAIRKNPPAPPRHSAPRPGAGHHGHPDRLGYMVKHATKGCHDVKVWRVDDESYIVRYRKGRKHYTRRIYPYSNRYGAITLINSNWQPLAPWVAIPPIQININI
jgi:hypothetical protein